MSKDILIVEDDDSIRELIVEKIKEAGFYQTIYQAADPMQALEHYHLHKDRIGFVVCDYYLPVQNGNDLCKMIKETSPDCTVICLTGDSTVKLEDHRTEVDGVYYKPEGLKEVVELIMKKNK